MADRNIPSVLTPEQVAEALHVSLSTLAHWRCDGAAAGPAFLKLPNGKVRYEAEAVAAWLESRRARTTAEAA